MACGGPGVGSAEGPTGEALSRQQKLVAALTGSQSEPAPGSHGVCAVAHATLQRQPARARDSSITRLGNTTSDQHPTSVSTAAE